MRRPYRMLAVLLMGTAWFLLMGTGMAAEPIKVGGLFALSGPAAHIGVAQKDSCKLIFEEVNQAGGINGRMIEFIEADTEGDPTKTLMKTKWLVEEQKVSVIVGPTRTGSGMAIKPYIDEVEVPIFMHAGSDVIIMKPPVHWVFKSPYKTSAALGKVFEYCKKEGLQNVAFMYAFAYDPQFDLIDVLTVPFFAPNGEVGSRVGWALYEKFPEIQAQWKDVKLITTWTTDPYIIITTKKQIKTLEDFKGMKMRVTGPMATEMMKRLGGVPMAIPMPPPTIPLAPRLWRLTSAMCIDPPRPRQ